MKLQLARAQALLNQKKPNPDEAMKVLQPLVKRKNAPWPVYHYCGIAFLQKKEYQTALSFLNESVEQGADEPETHHSISLCYFNLENFELAEEYEKTALQKKPDFFKGWLHLGSIYRAQARLDEALKCFHKANQLDPKSASVAYRIAEIYNDQGDTDKALELYDIAIKVDSDFHDAYLARAGVLQKVKRFDEAEEHIYTVLNDEPLHLLGRVALAEHYKLIGNYDNAIELYEKLVKDYPKVGGVRVNYALCLQELGRFDESEKHYMIAFEDQPDSFESLSNYLMGIHYNPDRSKEEIFEAHKLWDTHFAPKESPERPIPFDTSRDKKLRLGFISGGFRTHPVGWMITKALENLSSDQFEVYCYTTNNKYDQITKRIHGVATKWQAVIGYNDEVLARLIREDEIDILVELSGHSADTRLRTVALEPAPVIVKWVGGLFNTTGLKSVDYLLTDHHETPKGEEEFYTEKLVRMPDDYICFMPPEYAPDVKELPAKKNGYITFGCFNNPTKVNDEILKQWAAVMSRVPESRLFLKSKQYDTEALCERIIETMKSCGIDRERLIFEGLSPHDELLEKYNDVDIALDPWPYSGGLTTCEALWMGVPVVTKPGPTFAGRHSTTHLINAGLPELVVDSWEQYADKVVELTTDLEALTELRNSLREKMENSPLTDGNRFGVHFGKAMRSVWNQWVDGFEQGEEGWQSHIDVEAIHGDQIERSVEKVEPSENVQGILDHIDYEMDFAASEEEDVIVDQTLTKGKARESGAYVNGIARSNGKTKKSETSETEKETALYKIETKDGVTVCTPPDLKLLTPYVLLEQSQWYENELDFVREYLKEGMNVVDAGAGFGVYALPAAKLVGNTGQVYAFEPGDLARYYLEFSKIENGLQNLNVLGKALSNNSGKHSWIEGETPELHRLYKNGEKEVSVITLDSWWAFEGEPKVDLIKLDLNGHETTAIEGAKTFLSENTPVVLLAMGENREHASGLANQFSELGYTLFEYIPGPGLLTPFDAGSGLDSYLQNLIALKPETIQELSEKGWIHDESYTPEEPEAGVWKEVIGEFPWAKNILANWEKKSLSPKDQTYLSALNYQCAVEIEETGDKESRSRIGVWLLAAAQKLVQLYNSGENGTEVTFTLTRVLNALGKRGQAVEVMQKLMETTKLGQENMEVDLPFLPPLPEQDHTEIKTEFKNWLTVRTVEAWISLKDLSTYLSGPQEKKMLELLEGNAEVIDTVNHIILITKTLNNSDISEKEIEKISGLIGKRRDRQDIKSKLATPAEKNEITAINHIIFNRKFWTENFTPAKAQKVVEITKKINKSEYNREILNQVILETESRLREAGDDNVAFFIQVHALLALNQKSGDATNIDQELIKALKEKSWEHKTELYNYWFDRVDFRKEVENPEVSTIIISNRFKEKSVENLKRLSRQLKERGEIIFVNNGVEDSEFDSLIEYADIYVKAKGNSGAYLARNLGALFAQGNYLLFVDDDGIPDEGFVDAHLDVHNQSNIVVARGACYSGNGNDPAHYNLGNKIKPAPTYLEGNTSYRSKIFWSVDGWGDYIMFGHGGMELWLRLALTNVKESEQVYTPFAKLKHDYSNSPSHLASKQKRQEKSFYLIKTLMSMKKSSNSNIQSSLMQAKINENGAYKTPSGVIEISSNKLSRIGVNQSIVIPKNEAHRISNIFEKNEYALPAGVKLKENCNILDVGANVGIFALYAAKWSKNANIYCFEPNPQVHPLLEKNTETIHGVRIYYHAMGEQDGELVLNQHPRNTGQTSTTLRFSNGKKINVPVKDSGKVVDELDLKEIDVIKIDTEGAELPILRGMLKHLKKVKIIMAEYHTEDDRREIEKMLSDFMLYSIQIEELRGVGTVKYINEKCVAEIKNNKSI